VLDLKLLFASPCRLTCIELGEHCQRRIVESLTVFFQYPNCIHVDHRFSKSETRMPDKLHSGFRD